MLVRARALRTFYDETREVGRDRMYSITRSPLSPHLPSALYFRQFYWINFKFKGQKSEIGLAVDKPALNYIKIVNVKCNDTRTGDAHGLYQTIKSHLNKLKVQCSCLSICLRSSRELRSACYTLPGSSQCKVETIFSFLPPSMKFEADHCGSRRLLKIVIWTLSWLISNERHDSTSFQSHVQSSRKR